MQQKENTKHKIRLASPLNLSLDPETINAFEESIKQPEEIITPEGEEDIQQEENYSNVEEYYRSILQQSKAGKDQQKESFGSQLTKSQKKMLDIISVALDTSKNDFVGALISSFFEKHKNELTKLMKKKMSL